MDNNTFDNNNFNNANFGSTSPESGQGPAPQINNYYSNQPAGDAEKPYSVWQWVGTMFLTMIPCVNLILMIVWACSAENKSKKNWAIATFVVMGIILAIYIVLIIIFGASMVAAFRSLPDIMDYAM